MPTLILSSRSIAYDHALAVAATTAGWQVMTCDGVPLSASPECPVVYVSTDHALAVARQLGLDLIEPPFDLLARIPDQCRRRTVEYATFADLARLRQPTFVKPADPLDKWFDAGTYSDPRDIRTRGRSDPTAPVLLSEPVEWSAEYRCFVLHEVVVTGSPYLTYGRPCWKPFARPATRPRLRQERASQIGVPEAALTIVDGLCRAMRGRLPPAFVVDVGMIEDRGWAVVEFNPVWCAGLLGADPAAILTVLQRATRPNNAIGETDRRWVIPRQTHC